MSFIFDIPLDISKSPQEVLLTKFNAVNGLQLKLEDFVFADPEPNSSGLWPQADTMVKVMPKATSVFYSNFYIYYNRMDIGEIMDNPMVSIARGNWSALGELIPEINLAFNINITADDFYDSPLPAVNTVNPNAVVPVMFSVRPESLLFTGSHLLLLNKVRQDPSISYMEEADVLMVLNQPYDPVMFTDVVVKTIEGNDIPNFQFLSNTTTKTLIDIDDAFQVKNKGIVFQGQFQFEADLGTGPQSYDTNAIMTNTSGAIMHSIHNKYGSDLRAQLIACKNTRRDYRYVIDPNNTLGTYPSQLYRFDHNGDLDTVFQLRGMSYPLSYARIDSKGRIYTVSQMMTISTDHDNNPATPNINVKQYWIDRYLPNGDKDGAFSRVRITRTGAGDPWPIACIEPIEDDYGSSIGGAYVAFAFTEQPSSLLPSPVINGQAMIAGNVTGEYGYLPIIRLDENGNQDTYFNHHKQTYLPSAIFENDPSKYPKIGEYYITAVGNSVTMLSYRRNPMTGQIQHLPMMFDYLGQTQATVSQAYLTTYYWKQSKEIESMRHNSSIVYGSARLFKPDGTYGEENQIVASYNNQTNTQSVIYQTEETPQGKPTIQRILTIEGRQ